MPSNPWRDDSLPNDPMLPHRSQVSGRAVKRAPDARELTNPATDPFMVNPVHGGAASRPRLKVRIVGARGLPDRGSNIITYGTCMAKTKKTSTFRTREAHDSCNPVWDEPGQMVNRWVPGDVLLFRIFDKDRSGLVSSLMASETIEAQCEMRSDEYYPNGFRGSLPLFTSHGSPIPGASLQVETQVYGVSSPSLWEKISEFCNPSHWNCSALLYGIQRAPGAIIKAWYDILGEPADGRTKNDMAMLIAIPCIVFLLLTWLGWILRHFNSAVLFFLAGIAFCMALGSIVLGTTTHKHSKKPLFALGCLVLLSVIMALTVCENGWNECWRQWWWMHTGNKVGASASTPAQARSDASVIAFDTAKQGTAWTSVDAGRAAGYRKGDIYCAAPILDPNITLGDIIRVEFWAIGINCCNDFGSFTCDAAREISGSIGVVMKGDGMPCAGCHANEFRLAALKAAGMNRMVSAPGAMYVRYVSNAKKIEDLYIAKCVSSVFWSLLLGVVVFGLLGFLTNYKSWGKPGHFPLYNSLSDTKKVPAALHQEGFGRQAQVNDLTIANPDKKWILKLSPSSAPGGFSVAASKPQDDQ